MHISSLGEEIDFVHVPEAGRDGNRRDQVNKKGTKEKNTGRDDWNRGAFSGGYRNSAVQTS